VTLTRLTRSIAPALALGMVVLAGCGSSSKSSSTAAAPATTSAPAPAATTPAAGTGGTSSASALSLAANPEGQLKYDKTSLTASAGKVAIAFTNTAPLAHNLTIEGTGGTSLGATPTFQGGSKVLSLTLKAGTYKFYCSVPGHRQAGMEGTLTVK
jgi:plastocyanin